MVSKEVEYNNDVELEYHVSQLKAAVLSEAQWNSDEGDVSKPRSFEQHMLKSTKPHHCFYNKDYTYLVDLNTEEKYTTSITKHYAARYHKEGIEDMIPKEVYHYHFKALNVRRSNDKEYEFSYAYLPRLSMNDVEDMYFLQVQDKLHHLPLELLKDFNNALLMFIRRTVIKNRVEDIQLRVKSYQRSLNLTKPIIFFKGIDQRIPFTMTATHKGVVYLNQYNIKSLMKLSEVKKFCDGTLVKIQENLIDMLSKNKLGSGNKRHREQLRRLEEYVGGRPKTVNPYAPSLSTSQTPQETQSLVIPSGVEEQFHDIEVAHLDNDPFFGVLVLEPSSKESSSRDVIPTNVHSINQPPEHLRKWTKDHLLDNVIDNPSQPISTRH
ncbi:hypothetical protein Tco_1530751 [Tanacetum coccineum]